MITTEKANKLAQEWIESWNSHNIDNIMVHYAENVDFTSPLIVQILNKPDGRLVGKAILKDYFLKGLTAYPDLKFELYHVLAGVNSIVIYYKSVKNLIAAEVLILNEEGLVKECICHYKEMGV